MIRFRALALVVGAFGLALFTVFACSSTSSNEGASDAGAGDDATTIDAAACVIPKVADPQVGGCTQASDCQVRFTGEFCCTPEGPQAITSKADEALDAIKKAIPQACKERCKTLRCGLKMEAGADCQNGQCVLTP